MAAVPLTHQVLRILALLFGLGAIAFCWNPWLIVLTLLLGVPGMSLSLAALFRSRTLNVSPVLPSVAVALNALALLVQVFWFAASR